MSVLNPIYRFIFTISIFFGALSLTAGQAVAAPTEQDIQIFGTTLKGAKREQLRQTLAKGGMQATREDSNYWFDIYDPRGALEGASKFSVGYVSKSDQFASAEYAFSSFMDKALVKKIVDLVASKYGRPSSVKGQYNLGPVTATWKLPKNMKIEVSRGWPDTTTYLTFIDVAAIQTMQAEMDAMEKRQKQQKSQAQSRAF